MTEPFYDIKKVWRRSLTSSLGNLSFGLANGTFTSSQSCMADLFKWGDNSYTYIAVMSSLIPLGALFGATFAGYLSKTYGKRKNLIISDCIMISGSCIVQIPFTPAFGIGRFLCGMAVGCFSMLSAQYVNEFTPRDIRSKMGTLNQLMAMLGMLFSFSICQLLPRNKCDQEIFPYVLMIFALPGIAALIQLILFVKVFKRESPDWFIKHQQYDQALSCLVSIYDKSYAEKEIVKIKNLNVGEVGASGEAHEYSVKELLTCTKGTTKFMRVGTLFHIFQQITGINAILFYSTLLFLDLGEGLFVARALTIMSSVLRIFSVFVILPIIDKLNRKKVLVVCTFLMGCCFWVLAFILGVDSLKIMMVGLIMLFLCLFSISLGPICWIYTSEIMSDKGLAIATSANWGNAFIVVLTFPLLIEALGLQTTFIIFAVLNIIASMYFLLDMVDTSGMSKADIKDIISKMS